MTDRPRLSGQGLRALYQQLLSAYGEQSWWPAEHAFEIAVGAVLTQNTQWSNVEKALAQLRAADVLQPGAMLALPQAQLAELIRPSGYYRVKAQRLIALCEFLDTQGGLDALGQMPLENARHGLLSVKGVGPETADDILLYALDRPVFVIDTYTRRLLQRQRLARGNEPYEVLRQAFEQALPEDAALFRQYHALIVTHAKAVCRKLPACANCALNSRCAQALNA